MSVRATVASTDEEVALAASAAIRGNGPMWFADLATRLAQSCWSSLACEAGLDLQSYGTARVRVADSRAERDVQRSIPTPYAFGRRRPILIETLRPSIAARYEDLGLQLATPDQAASDAIATQLIAALECLALVPDLAASIGSVLEVVHVVIPESPDFDVSYSDPDVPFSAWVGIGAKAAKTTALRLAECLLHESMHLQLSLIEAHVPLVNTGVARLHSPWQHTMRPIQGIVHGVYVFSVIRDFMVALRNSDLVVAAHRHHVAERIATCTAEIAAVTPALAAIPDLTAMGRELLACVTSRPAY